MSDGHVPSLHSKGTVLGSASIVFQWGIDWRRPVDPPAWAQEQISPHVTRELQ
ncbi:putative cysteine protease ATG4, partial [Clarias magur]